MTSGTYILALGVTVPFLAFIVRLVRKRRLRAKYSFLWLLVGGAVFLLSVIPNLMEQIASLVGIIYPPAVLFLGAIMLLMFLGVHFSWELSRLEDRTRTLAEELALSNTRIAELERVAAVRGATSGVAGARLVEKSR